MIVKRGKGFGVSVYDAALKRKRWVGTFRTRAEAREAEREASRRRHGGGRMTCGEFAATWPDDYPRKAGATRRSYRLAINVLAAAGYTQAYNILDGMEGSRVDDPDSVFNGMRLKNGWKASGLPWTYDLDPGRMALPERETGTLHAGNEDD